MYLSIHSPTEDLHLDCSCVLAIMNKAWCAGFRVDVSFQIIWINNQEHDCWIIQWEYVCLTISQSLWIIYTLGSNDRELLQLSMLTSTWYPQCLDLSHSNRLCWHLIVQPAISQKLASFPRFFVICLSTLDRYLFSFSVHFLIGLFIFLSLNSSLYILDTSFIMCLKDFPSSLDLPFFSSIFYWAGF